ncbi:MAG: hypothetical protein AB7F31_05005 [Parachlamydiales bacterium]
MQLGLLVMSLLHLGATNVADVEEAVLKEMTLGHRPEVVLVLEEGQQLPAQALIGGELLQFWTEGPLMVEVKRTFYCRCANEDVELSLDGENWRPMAEFITGSAGVALGDRGLLTFRLEANVRAS